MLGGENFQVTSCPSLRLLLRCWSDVNRAARSCLTSASVGAAPERGAVYLHTVALASGWSAGVKTRASPLVNTSRLKMSRVSKDARRDCGNAPLVRERRGINAAATNRTADAEDVNDLERTSVVYTPFIPQLLIRHMIHSWS